MCNEQKVEGFIENMRRMSFAYSPILMYSEYNLLLSPNPSKINNEINHVLLTLNFMKQSADFFLNNKSIYGNKRAT